MKVKNRFQNFIIVSLVVHSILAILTWMTPKLKQTTSPVEITFLESSPIEKEMTLQDNDKIQAHQVVETDEKAANNTIDEKAKFLSAKNNSVTKETQARLGTEFKNTQKMAANKPTSANQKKSKPSLFGDKFNAYEALEKKSGHTSDFANSSEQQNKNNPSQAGSESTSTDKVQNVDQSLKTALNTREYKYYGYYQRIKTQLNQWWQPQVKEKVSRLMTKGRTIATTNDNGNTNKITKLIIVLNDTGTLVNVQVLAESGVRDLDDAAIEAFRQAAPFPNPPKGMVENDGTIKIRWDFVVES